MSRRHRLPPPRRREDGRAPDLAHLHPLHRPHRLPRRRHEQPRLPAVGRAAGRHRGAGARPGHPRHALRALPHQQPPAVLRHLRPGHRRAVARLLHVHRPRAHPRHHRRPSPAAACTPAGSASAAWPRTCPRAGRSSSATSSRYLPPRLDEYDHLVLDSRITKARAKGVGPLGVERGDRVGRHRAQPALGCGLRLGLPQEAALLGLRPVRVRHADRRPRRLLRPRLGAQRGDPPEPAHHRASASSTCRPAPTSRDQPLATPPVKEPAPCTTSRP